MERNIQSCKRENKLSTKKFIIIKWLFKNKETIKISSDKPPWKDLLSTDLSFNKNLKEKF